MTHMLETLKRTFASGTLSGEAKKADQQAQKEARIKAIHAEMAELNTQPPSTARDGRAAELADELEKLAPDQKFDLVRQGGSILFRFWDSNPQPLGRQRKADDREERLEVIGWAFKVIGCGAVLPENIVDRLPELRQYLNLSEYQRIAAGAALEKEQAELRAELATEKAQKGAAAWEALRPRLKEAAEKVTQAQEQLRAELEKLLPQERALVEALAECFKLAAQAEGLLTHYPSLESGVSLPFNPNHAPSRTPGAQIAHLARHIGKPLPSSYWAGGHHGWT